MAPQFTLPDGRTVDYALTGAKNGLPLLWFHGTPGAYTPNSSLVAACSAKGLRLITFSKPGYGGSSRRKGRRVVDGVADAEKLLRHLGVGKCVVGGWSGGGPYSLACAARLKGCVAALVVAGVAPYDADGLDFLAGQGDDNIQEFTAALKGEPALQAFCQPARLEMLQVDAAGMTELLTSILPPVDKQTLLSHESVGSSFVASIREALRQSADGWVDDDLAFVQPWGFDLAEIDVPVFLYQGSEDQMVPFAHGEWLAARIPRERLTGHLVEGEGHISIFYERLEGMLDELLGVAG